MAAYLLDKNSAVTMALEFILRAVAGVLGVWQMLAIIVLLKSRQKPKSVSLKEVIEKSGPYLMRSLGIAFLIAGAVIGVILPVVLVLMLMFSLFSGIKILFAVLAALVLIPVAFGIVIAISVYSIFSYYVLVNENAGIIASLKRSIKLVQGQWWRVFGFNLLTGLIVIGAALAVVLVMVIIGMILAITLAAAVHNQLVVAALIGFLALIGFSVLLIFSTPFSVTFMQKMYEDAKKSRLKIAS